MGHKLYYSEHPDCSVCTEVTNRGFEYIETQKGETHVFEMVDAYTLVFILSGEALVSCNEFVRVLFSKGEILLWPMNSNCEWESLSDTMAIVLTENNELPPCDSKALREYAEMWLNTVSEFKGLEIRPRMMEFLLSVKSYLDDGITCPYMHKAKLKELSTVFRAYYSPQELIEFFLPTVRQTHEFEQFVMNNYLRMKGVKEFVDLSGMKLSTFNRKFKNHFNESPYQWLIKQKSKHIYYALSSTNKSIVSISREFHFTDASHFNRYCKSMFGASPSKIREGVIRKNM